MRSRPAKVQLLALLLGLALFSPSFLAARTSPAQKNAQAAKQYDRAVRLRTALEGKPQKDRKLAEYERAIETFRQVYHTSPSSPRAPSSILAQGELYLEMARSFDPKYFQDAIHTYQFLLREYPGSRYGQDALFTIGEIQRSDLSNLPAAIETFQSFLKRYPRSRRSARARAAIEELQKEAAAAAAAKARGAAPAAELTAGLPQVTNIRHWNTQNYTRVVIDIEDEVKYQGARIANPDRIFFDLFNTRLSSALAGKTLEVEDGFLKKIRVAQNQLGVTRVVLELDNIDNYSVFALPNPFRLVVDIYGTAAKAAKATPPVETATRAETKPVEARKEPAGRKPSETPAEKPAAESARARAPEIKPGPTVADPAKRDEPRTVAKAKPMPPPAKAARPTKNGSRTLTRALGLKIGRIVLDPGHGGHDTGTIGPTGFMEKDLVLDVALRLGKLIEERLEAELVFTRDDDTFVPLENRTALANQKQADLFLSIHANSSDDASARGIETYFLNLTTDKEALEIAARENAVSQKSIHELQDIIRKIARNEKMEESRELASELQQSLHRRLTKSGRAQRDRGVKQAPFIVLVGANMPSVLSEIAFLSNPDDEQLLKTPAYRQRVADALYDGVVKYLQSLNSVHVAHRPQTPLQDKSEEE